MIPKAENTSKHKYNQTNTINDRVRAIKAMQSTIRLEQYNHSNTISDRIKAIKAIQSAIQLGQTRGKLHYQ